jgi:hypothetical protein
MVLNSIFMGVLFYLKLNKPYTKKVLGILYGVSALLSVILFGASVGTVISLFFDENSGTICNALTENLSKSIPIIAVIFLIAVYPHIHTKAKKLIAVFMLLCSALWVINDFAPITPYKITSDPMVIDTGKDYSVVFSTSDYGTGYVEYTYEKY